MARSSALPEQALILGIETSCDETAAAVVRGGRVVLAGVVASQDTLHEVFGGVVPEVASRKHAELLTTVVERALYDAGVSWSELSGIAVTHRPGLIGSLVVGVAAAKAYAFARDRPLVGVDHVDAHLHANVLVPRDAAHTVRPLAETFALPLVGLVASGGHADVLLLPEWGHYEPLACTRDDAPGEALDKAARVLGLGYPGGPAVERAAQGADAAAIAFPRPRFDDSLDFSFSGLKTALVRLMAKGSEASVPDVAASFQQAICDVLTRNTLEAVRRSGARTLLAAGGVVANSVLRAQLAAGAEAMGMAFHCPPPALCTDNAAMVAAAGFFALQRRGPDDLTLDAYST